MLQIYPPHPKDCVYPEHHIEGRRYEEQRSVEDGKEDGDLEAARGLLSRSRSVSITENNNEINEINEISISNVDDLPLSSIKLTISERVTDGTNKVVSPPPNHFSGTVVNTITTKEGMGMVAEDGNEVEDLELRYGFTSQAVTVSACDVPTDISPSGKQLSTFRAGYIPTLFSPVVPSIKVDGDTEPNSIRHLNDGNIEPSASPTFENDLITPEVMMMLKRHEAVAREVDKLCCIGNNLPCISILIQNMNLLLSFSYPFFFQGIRCFFGRL